MRSKRILFLGTHGQFNIGDELLLETFLSRLGGKHRYAVNSYDPEYTRRQLGDRYQVEIFSTNGSKAQFLRYIWQADLLFFGGGSIIKELYASVGRYRYATLMMIWLTVMFARWVARKPIIMSNIGVGPLLTPGGERIARQILRQVTFLSVRDRLSYDTCLRLGIPEARVQQVPDAVFSLDPEEFVGHGFERGTTDGVLKVALNLNYNIENPDNWETFLDSLATGMRDFQRRQPLEIHALPMQVGFKEHDDYQELSQFQQRIPEIEMHMHRPMDHREVGAIIAGCDIVVAERLHTLVISTILGKPFLGLMYDVKVQELVAGLDKLEFAININQPFAAKELTARLDSLCGQRDSLQRDLAMRGDVLRKDLAEYFKVVNLTIERLT